MNVLARLRDRKNILILFRFHHSARKFLTFPDSWFTSIRWSGHLGFNFVWHVIMEIHVYILNFREFPRRRSKRTGFLSEIILTLNKIMKTKSNFSCECIPLPSICEINYVNMENDYAYILLIFLTCKICALTCNIIQIAYSQLSCMFT